MPCSSGRRRSRRGISQGRCRERSLRLPPRAIVPAARVPHLLRGVPRCQPVPQQGSGEVHLQDGLPTVPRARHRLLRVPVPSRRHHQPGGAADARITRFATAATAADRRRPPGVHRGPASPAALLRMRLRQGRRRRRATHQQEARTEAAGRHARRYGVSAIGSSPPGAITSLTAPPGAALRAI